MVFVYDDLSESGWYKVSEKGFAVLAAAAGTDDAGGKRDAVERPTTITAKEFWVSHYDDKVKRKECRVVRPSLMKVPVVGIRPNLSQGDEYIVDYFDGDWGLIELGDILWVTWLPQETPQPSPVTADPKPVSEGGEFLSRPTSQFYEKLLEEKSLLTEKQWGRLMAVFGQDTEYEAICSLSCDDETAEWGGVLIFRDYRFSPIEPVDGLPDMFQLEYIVMGSSSGTLAMIRAENQWNTLCGVFKGLQASVPASWQRASGEQEAGA